jgi:hypothetical protein
MVSSMDFFKTISPQTVNLIAWIGGIASLVTIISFILASPQQIKAFFDLFRKKKLVLSQPRLAISLINGGRGRFRANDVMYHPFELGEDRVITFDQQKLLAFDWNLTWNFTLKITNQTEYTAYNVRIADFPHEEQFVQMHLTPPIDITTPFKPHDTEAFEVVCRLNHRATAEEADVIIKNYPFKALRIEYTNPAGDKFATVFSTAELQVDKKNQYLDLGKSKPA